MKWQAFKKNVDTKTDQHLTDEAPAPPLPFSRQNAFERLHDLYNELNRESWPELLTAWLQDFHPAALQRIRNSTQQIDDAFKAGNDRQLDRALTEQRAAWLAGLQLYRQQQGDL